jgi:hypothetical protein
MWEWGINGCHCRLYTWTTQKLRRALWNIHATNFNCAKHYAILQKKYGENEKNQKSKIEIHEGALV